MTKRNFIKIVQLSLIVLLVAVGIWFVNRVGIEQVRANVDQLGVWAPLAVISLRMVSVVIPALPSTAYSILSGVLFGFAQGIVVIAIADLIACNLNFYIAKRYGRSLVQKFVGQRFISRVDSLSQKYLERNIFLVTGFLMTGLFDFVAYAVGLTQMKWRSFILALILGIAISTPPIVALGAGVFEGGRILLVGAMLGIFALAMLTGWLSRKKVASD
ncbi:SNARE associated Golgi family protein [Gloeocapsa sp. PCC 7428]|uniref:TVP38/TMEM64 family protein n=1 Tax=Gloeocapsa sp. PCC 7428 TaxID=1173026 RepID=UPI0002A61B02|nr:VTT domain-containing protein [Gloeocapsa sp. PCC 7428]AFZ30438.1 SNARE associated Golgi family protein [Gloeocapsa sp. PCC 7428]